MTADPTTTFRWIVPRPYDSTPASLAEHEDAIGAVMRGEGRLWLGPFAPPSRLPAALADTALVVPTSGSTGTAKAVALSRAALIASQDATASVLGGHGVWLPLLPPTHIAGVQIIARAHRTALVLGLDSPALPATMPDLARHFDAAALLDAARPTLDLAERLGLPACTSLVPTQLTRILADTTPAGREAIAMLGRFAAVLVGGAATPAPLLAAAQDAGIAVRTTYGSSETGGGCVYDGAPLPGVDLLLDDDGADAEGRRLLIGSPTLALALLHPDGTANTSSFRREGGRRLLVTSDLAALDGGRLRILGRADDVVITGGRKVLPQDVESAIDAATALRDLLADRVVVGVPDPEWGERLVALVVPTDPLVSDLPGLITHALRAGDLPRHALPKRVIAVPELRVRGIGKIDRRAARDLAITLSA